MKTIDNIRNSLIDKLQSINNKDVLEAIDKLISTRKINSEDIEFTEEQIMMLEMSENDIKNGNVISQEAMNKRNFEWLNAM
ncbi:hypothetical protein [Polaribacter sp. Asnod6-C07]|uniref:hypothetical protein n=1 Tax=Polaribacter sp. Asnod6-C07 TaxID=3160582 RepID=UPI00386B0509